MDHVGGFIRRCGWAVFSAEVRTKLALAKEFSREQCRVDLAVAGDLGYKAQGLVDVACLRLGVQEKAWCPAFPPWRVCVEAGRACLVT